MPQRFINGIDYEFADELKKVVEGLIEEVIAQPKIVPSTTLAESLRKSAMDRFDDGLNELQSRFKAI